MPNTRTSDENSAATLDGTELVRIVQAGGNAKATTAAIAALGYKTAPIANPPMGGFKFTGLAAGSGSGDSVNYGQLSAAVLMSSQTLNVPGTYSTIQAAINSLNGSVIAAGATVTIQVADGTYTLASSIIANHPSGANIQILGNLTTPANCILTVSGAPTFDALVTSDGRSLGLVDGFTFTLASKATQANNSTAVLALNGGEIRTGPNIRVNNWYYGAAARIGSELYCRGIQVANAGDVGIWSTSGSSVDCQGATSTGASDVANSLGFGFQAEHGSAMDATNANASGCLIGGIASLSSSHVNAPGAVSSSNTGSGFFVRDGATIENHGATASNNTRYGEEWLANGRCYHNTFTAAGNTLGVNNGQVYLDNGSNGARIAANGPLRIDNNGTASTFFNTSNGLVIEVRDGGATSTSYSQFTSGNSVNSDQPTWSATGTATNIATRRQSKGTGSHYNLTGGGLQFEVFSTSTAVNWIGVTGSATGGAPRFQAFGTDPNIPVRATPKGTAAFMIDGVQNCANDAAAATAGVAVNGLYRIGNAIQIRLV